MNCSYRLLIVKPPASSLRPQTLAHPLALCIVQPPELQTLGATRAVVRDNRAQLIPIGHSVAPAAVGLLAQRGIGQGKAQLPDARHIGGDELAAQLLITTSLNAPDRQILVALGGRRRAMHLHQRAPPAIKR